METKRIFPSGKCAIRKQHKMLRDMMSETEVREKSQLICERVSEELWYRNCNMLLGYYPLGNEVDCYRLLQQAIDAGKTVALPRTELKNEEPWMDFFEISSLDDLTEGNFHVLEPGEECRCIKPIEAAAVLVPGVVFDRRGNRYGYGKGYYDRYFSRFPKLNRFALAYEHQLEQELLVLPTDRKMHRLYSETDRYDFECNL